MVSMDWKTASVLSLAIVAALVLGLTWSFVPPVGTTASGEMVLEGVDVEVPSEILKKAGLTNIAAGDPVVRVKVDKVSIDLEEQNIDALVARLMVVKEATGSDLLGGASWSSGWLDTTTVSTALGVAILIVVGVYAAVVPVAVVLAFLRRWSRR